MASKKLFKHLFVALLFSVLWTLIYSLGDEGNGGIVAESFYDAVNKLPFLDRKDFPSTFFLGFVIYPVLIYTIIAVTYRIVYQLIRSRSTPS